MPAGGRLGRSDTLKPSSCFRAQKRRVPGKAWKVSDRGSLNKRTRLGGQQQRYRSTTDLDMLYFIQRDPVAGTDV
jgi:hypothetical protein